MKTSHFLSFQAIVVAFCFLFPHHSLPVCRFCQQLCDMEQLCKLGLHQLLFQLLGQTFFVFPFALQESEQCLHSKTFCQSQCFQEDAKLVFEMAFPFQIYISQKNSALYPKNKHQAIARFSAKFCVVPVALKYATNFFIFLSSAKIFYHNF